MKKHKLLRAVFVTALVTSAGLSHALPRYDPYGEPRLNTSSVSLPNTQWGLADISPEQGSISYQGMKKMTLGFSSNGGISGDTGCNEFWSNYQLLVSKRMLTLGEIEMTKVGCPNHREERTFLNTLEKARYYKYESYLLKLEDANHRYLMGFIKSR